MTLCRADIEIMPLDGYRGRNACGQISFPNELARLSVQSVNDSIESTEKDAVVGDRRRGGPMEIRSLIGITAAEGPLNPAVFKVKADEFVTESDGVNVVLEAKDVRESPSRPCSTPAENHNANSRRSCWHQCGRSFSWPPRWPVASADAPPSLLLHAA